MTPLTIAFNIVLFLVWKLRLTSLGWLFFDSFPAVLRYPELEKLREKFKEEVEKYQISSKYDLSSLLPQRPESHLFLLTVRIETNDPIIAWLDRIRIEGTEKGFWLADLILSLLFRVPSPSLVLVDPRVWGFIALDAWIIWKYFLGGNYWHVFAFTALIWFGLFRLLGSLIVGDWLANLITELLKERDYGVLWILAILLLPISTADSLAIFSLIDLMEKKTWKIKARIDCVGLTRKGSNTWDFFLEYLRKGGVIDRLNNKFLPRKAEELQNLLVNSFGRRVDLDSIYREIERDLYNFLRKEVGEERLQYWFVKSKFKSFLNWW